jgi:3-oxoacyl-(acyl-carrier-protein) synthase/acyl carrier protein
LTEEKSERLKKLEEMGAQVEYQQVDVVDRTAVDDLLRGILDRYGKLDGIVHSAGVVRDSLLLRKTPEDLRAVLAPKVKGVVNLDDASRELPLDFFLMFSSLAGALGNMGQADYATGNAFMDAYANYRQQLVEAGSRHGQSLSINWPLWEDGGMHVSPTVLEIMRKSMGLTPLSTEEGVAAFYQALACKRPQVVVLSGEPQRLRKAFRLERNTVEPAALPEEKDLSVASETGAGLDPLKSWVSLYFRKLIGATLQMPLERIEADTPLENYGIDSVIVMQLTGELEKSFGSLSKTLLYEHQTIEELAEYFVQKHSAQLRTLLGMEEKTAVPSKAPAKPVSNPSRNGRNLPPARVSSRKKRSDFVAADAQEIAVIGISGRYPLARNADEFWENLKAGKDCVTEIPQERWDHSLYFDPEKGRTGKSYSKWGGFLEGIDEFDPLFFNISPREALYMDPQERLFLETVWKLLEGSGYTRESLHQRYQGKVGVYVGSMYQQYGSLASRSAIANRVSYCFGLQGPSMAIDTMCSSAVVAIHTACNDLLRGDCLMAIAGGVNLSTHPAKYVTLSEGQLIGSRPESRSFAAGDGYLPSEAVGAVLLKPLSLAIAEKDNILAVIKGSTVNHNGRSNGYSVPNPNTQAQLIEHVLAKCGVDARTISYVEAAAAGSALGDPMELAALNKAFEKSTTDRQFCAIGSVKSNLGHAEAASGMTQFMKVVLQMQNHQLAPSIHLGPLNPNLKFDDTPFFLQQTNREWTRPVVSVDGQEREYPRRAILNSFGAGGTNACLLVEEYLPPARKSHEDSNSGNRPQVIILSAKNPDRLAAMVRQMLEHIKKHPEISLANLAYTLQLGREAMNSRLAMVVNSHEELVKGLDAYLSDFEGRGGVEAFIPLFAADTTDQSVLKKLTTGKAGEMLVQALFAENNLEKLALFWTQGGKISWASLHEGREVCLIPLPTYPFEKIRLPAPVNHTNGSRKESVTPIDPNLNGNSETSGIVQPAAPVVCALHKAQTVAPRTELERTVLEIWEEVLGVSGIGVEDNFLEYGGNSIQAAEILAKVQKIFSVEIPLKTLLGAQPTVAGVTVAIVSELVRLEDLSCLEEQAASPIS